MNDGQSRFTERLDRLVDGELTRDEYARARELERRPDGWRQCALAFLEAQAWSVDSRGLCPTPPSAPTPATRSAWWGFAARLAAVAASFLVALGLGIWWRSTSTQPPAPTNSGEVNSVRSASALEEPPANDIGDSHDDVGLATRAPDHVTLIVNQGDGVTRRIQLPVYDPQDPRLEQLLEEPVAMPSEIRELAQSSGYEVQPRRDWAEVRFTDGRRGMAPVDRFQITPISLNAFQ